MRATCAHRVRETKKEKEKKAREGLAERDSVCVCDKCNSVLWQP